MRALGATSFRVVPHLCIDVPTPDPMGPQVKPARAPRERAMSPADWLQSIAGVSRGDGAVRQACEVDDIAASLAMRPGIGHPKRPIAPAGPFGPVESPPLRRGSRLENGLQVQVLKDAPAPGATGCLPPQPPGRLTCRGSSG
jgi:hypothetical protein